MKKLSVILFVTWTVFVLASGITAILINLNVI